MCKIERKLIDEITSSHDSRQDSCNKWKNFLKLGGFFHIPKGDLLTNKTS